MPDRNTPMPALYLRPTLRSGSLPFVPSTKGVGTERPADANDDKSIVTRLGIAADHLVQEIGYDDDCDDDLRAAIEAATGEELLDEDTDEVVDVVLLWWRDFDGDLVDALVDAIGPLADHGSVVLLTPKPGREGHVSPSDIADAAPTAGLQQTSSFSAAKDWQGTRLVAPRAARR